MSFLKRLKSMNAKPKRKSQLRQPLPLICIDRIQQRQYLQLCVALGLYNWPAAACTYGEGYWQQADPAGGLNTLNSALVHWIALMMLEPVTRRVKNWIVEFETIKSVLTLNAWAGDSRIRRTVPGKSSMQCEPALPLLWRHMLNHSISPRSRVCSTS
ncbi:hypothetical protein IFM61606_07164 [Aspergillus udagawae]|uniref:Uncharacterized protein n=1 Tax=Aspergillus udagawae TaxID=91492 RepID=A0ABQ1ALZ6_9EURO|nr:hypothetical protein IFM51744_04193 [Aspergillus udagawae]GFF84377.1 hypothetical protein IFM53868_04126 [Aspergillus udagawae]GFG16190.1 hypothetical protein IFM5058_07835 [Aspergillus udagawae]GFG27147.1 hypothetical protein IFM61606_07164 [Aspergillus udagawae]